MPQSPTEFGVDHRVKLADSLPRLFAQVLYLERITVKKVEHAGRVTNPAGTQLAKEAQTWASSGIFPDRRTIRAWEDDFASHDQAIAWTKKARLNGWRYILTLRDGSKVVNDSRKDSQ